VENSISRVIAAAVHELLKVETFSNHADLTEAVKVRCARLRIPYDCGLVAAALDAVARTRPLLQGNRRAAPSPRLPLLPSVPNGGDSGRAILSRAEAAAIVAKLRVHIREMA